MLKFNKKASEPQWVKYAEDESVEILIKPLSMYYLKKLPTGNIELTSEEFGNLICELIVDWKGIFDEDEKPLPCTKETKLLIADHAQDLAAFVMTTASEMKGKITIREESSKN